MWSLQDAIKTINILQPQLQAAGFHTALAGSVLFKGESKKDLDIIVYPHKYSKKFETEWRPAINVIEKTFSSVLIQLDDGKYSERDDKHVYVIKTLKGKRIDFFFLQ